MTLLAVEVNNLDGSKYLMQNLNVDKAIKCPFCFNGIETQPISGLKTDIYSTQFFLKC